MEVVSILNQSENSANQKKRANQVAAGLRYVHTGVHTYGSGTHQLQVFSLSPRMNSNTALENNNHKSY